MPFVSRRTFLPALIASAVGLAGCGGGAEPAAGEAETPGGAEVAANAPAGPAAAEAVVPEVPPEADPVSPYGTFRLLVPNQQQLLNFGSVRLVESAGAGAEAVEAFTPTEQLERLKPTVAGGEAGPDGVRVRLTLGAQDGAWLQFEGTPRPGAVVGTVRDNEAGQISPALLVPLPPGEANPGAGAFGDPEFEKIVRAVRDAPDPLAGLATAADRRPYAPVLFTLYAAALGGQAQEGVEPEQLRAVVEDYLAFAEGWGPWAAVNARRTAGQVLIQAPAYRELGEELLTGAAASIPAGAPDGLAATWEAELASLRERADRQAELQKISERTAAAVKRAEGGDPAGGLAEMRAIRFENPDDRATLYVLAEGLYRFAGEDRLEELRAMHAEHPLEALPAYLLAQAERGVGNADEANRLFAVAAAIPGGESVVDLLLQAKRPADDFVAPRVRLKEVLGDDDAVADRLTETYDELARGLAGEPRAADEADRTVLAEFFTGAQCAPCVPADMATAAVAAAFPREDFLLLQYHLHVPAPDPLTNADAVARATAAQIDATPTLLIDGVPTADPVGGPVTAAPDVFARLAETVEARRAVEPGAAVTVAAEAAGDRFTVSAGATREDGFGPTHRLHLAIAERSAVYAAPNGVRTHEMLVRSLPTGPKGVSADGDGALSFEAQLSVTGLREELEAYLTGFENQRGGEFPDKPLALTDLAAVAWVTDGETGEVLQSAFAPIDGLTAPPAAEPATVENTIESADPARTAADDAVPAGNGEAEPVVSGGNE